MTKKQKRFVEEYLIDSECNSGRHTGRIQPRYGKVNWERKPDET